MSKKMIVITSVLVGFAIGIGTWLIYDIATKKSWVCSCEDTGGGALWSANCPEKWVNDHRKRCPEVIK